MLARHCRRHGAGLTLRRLQLHQDRREPLREVVVNVAREPIALLEYRLAPLLEPALLRQAALMERQRRLPRHRFEHRDAPLQLARRRAGARQADPPEIPAAEHEWRDRQRLSTPAPRLKARTASGNRTSSPE